ncbi:MAG: bifunctional phosphoribosyl-AMP cyclohydrolase/phosphoribosyl-ATP diphosphatase HisIE [Firmicutes bacterium]|nr:bifunctional phosphoribosyl-AMP cyclohydrolase/phosphoribosyl-ATP diphosphatase HisIE [Bacillota bacterium]MBQ6810396.1 bifunctional phosphoribosyl-AMP cyclohydrolase/phosphoribosyl-ATP diphosphatase HisIE [Bacillota bacterium]
MNEFLKEIKFDEKGLVPAIAYDVISGEVVMMAYMNEESIRMTLESGYCTYFSRSRQTLWKKGETSGHLQKLRSMKLDCDGDTILLEIEQEGAACHTGNKSCFYREYKDGEWVPAKENTAIARAMALEYGVVKNRAENPVEGSYTNYLLTKGVDKICKKVGEEATECVIAAKNRAYDELQWEAADLIYHMTVLLYEQGMSWDDVGEKMLSRQKKD